MIIWLNGAFGVGKTCIATILHNRVRNSYIYDPELLGDFLQNQLPQDVCPKDFQDYPVWRQLTYQLLHDLATKTDLLIIVPMTIYKEEYYQDIIQRLIDDSIPVQHYILKASKATILERLDKRTNGDNSWARQYLERCLEAFEKQIPGTRLETDDRLPEDIVTRIIKDSEAN